MRMRRKKKNLVPRMERCAQWLISDPQALRGNWRSLLPGAKELRIELGCGKGRFTCQAAAAAPEVLFVAVERVPDAMVMAMERARTWSCTMSSLLTPTRPICRRFLPRMRWTSSTLTSATLGPQAPRQAEADPPGFPAALPAGAAGGGRDSLQDGQRGAVCLFRDGVSLGRFLSRAGDPRPPCPGHPGDYDRL